MAQKFLSLDEAAQTLGISKERLNQLREDNRIHAYRDGVGWKFKVEEVERVAQEMRDGTFDDEDALDLDFLGDENDSILLSEVELGDSENAPSTIIGKQDDVIGDDIQLGAGDSDLKLASESDLSLAGESGLALAGDSGLSPAGESDLTLAGDSEPAPADESDLTLAGESGLALADDADTPPQAGPSDSNVLAAGADQAASDPGETKGSGIGSHFDDLDELDLDLESASSTELPTTEPVASAESTEEEKEPELADLSGLSIDVGGSGLSLSGDDDDDLLLASEQSGLQLDGGSEISLDADASGLSLGGSDLLVTGDSGKAQSDSLMSDVALAPDESAIELSADDDDDDELVLGGALGSDITLGSGDSGINLAPSDSGLSLDAAPLELGGSAVESLDLSDDEVLLEEDTDSEVATQLKTDEDFLLTPLDDASGDAEDDSSQVIALDSESFDESAATMLGGDMLGGDMLGGGMEGAVGLEAAAPVGAAAGQASFATAGGAVAAASEPEEPYTVWNLLSLTLCAMLLALTGMMLFDLVRSVWSWNEPYALNSSLMDGLTQAIPIFK